jgi:nucleoside-diphosphate-sugar epimerase
MKILITGVHGFVGSNLVKVLSKDNAIYGLDIVSPDREGVERTYSWKDLENNALPDVDAIIHLAGKAHDTKNKSHAQDYFNVNTKLTEKIYDYYKTSKANKFIFFSSVKAAADFVPGNILTEDIVPAPVGPYGESKIEAEKYIQSHPTDKKVYILRPCMIHGPGNKGNLNLLYAVVKKGFPWPLGAFENKRTFTSIDNLSFIINKLLNKDVDSGIYHIADDEALSTNELIEIICKAMGKKPRILHLNKGLMKSLASCGDVLHLPLNSLRLEKLTENYVVSNSKIKKAIGIDHLPVRAEDGLLKTIKYFIENK